MKVKLHEKIMHTGTHFTPIIRQWTSVSNQLEIPFLIMKCFIKERYALGRGILYKLILISASGQTGEVGLTFACPFKRSSTVKMIFINQFVN